MSEPQRVVPGVACLPDASYRSVLWPDVPEVPDFDPIWVCSHSHGASAIAAGCARAEANRRRFQAERT